MNLAPSKTKHFDFKALSRLLQKLSKDPNLLSVFPASVSLVNRCGAGVFSFVQLMLRKVSQIFFDFTHMY